MIRRISKAIWCWWNHLRCWWNFSSKQFLPNNRCLNCKKRYSISTFRLNKHTLTQKGSCNLLLHHTFKIISRSMEEFSEKKCLRQNFHIFTNQEKRTLRAKQFIPSVRRKYIQYKRILICFDHGMWSSSVRKAKNYKIIQTSQKLIKSH